MTGVSQNLTGERFLQCGVGGVLICVQDGALQLQNCSCRIRVRCAARLNEAWVCGVGLHRFQPPGHRALQGTRQGSIPAARPCRTCSSDCLQLDIGSAYRAISSLDQYFAIPLFHFHEYRRYCTRTKSPVMKILNTYTITIAFPRIMVTSLTHEQRLSMFCKGWHAAPTFRATGTSQTLSAAGPRIQG